MATRDDLIRQLSARLRSEGTSTAVDELRRQGVRSVRFVRREHLEEMIAEALDRSLESELLALEGPARARLLESALARVRADANEVGGAAEASDPRDGEFESESENTGPRFGRGLDLETLSLVVGGVGATSVGESRRIALAVAGFLRAEEERLRDEGARAQAECVERLELRLARLQIALARAESALRAAASGAPDGETASLLAELREAARDAQRKGALLAELFERNALARA